MNVKLNTIERLISCLFVFGDANDLMKKFRVVAKNNADLIVAPNNPSRARAINAIFPIENAVTLIYFRDEDKKTSALFITYDNVNDEMHVHFARHLKYVTFDYDIFKYSTSDEYHFNPRQYVIKTLQRILNSLNIDSQNIYCARNSKDFPAYVKKVLPNKVCLTKVNLKDEEEDIFFGRIDDYNHIHCHRRSRSFCTRQPAYRLSRFDF